MIIRKKHLDRRPHHPTESVCLLPPGLFSALFLLLSLYSTAGTCGKGTSSEIRIVEYRGLCDASAASYLDGDRFIVGNDEDNVLRIYKRDESDPVKTVSLDEFLDLSMGEKNTEIDIEASARIGDEIYLMGSHGRDREGEIRSNRNRFFAVQVVRSRKNVNVAPVGRPYKNLLSDLLEDHRLAGLGLAEAAGLSVKKDPELSPKKRGLNIEGLSRMPGSRSLLIGFRNPSPEGKALLLPLLNPEGILFGGEKARFDDPVLLDLGGLTVRSIEYVEPLDVYLIVAGPRDGGNKFRLYTWSGKPSDPAVLFWIETGWMLSRKFTPEAFVVFPETKELLLISDDGTLPISVPGIEEPCPCKNLKRPEDRRFRGAWLKLANN